MKSLKRISLMLCFAIAGFIFTACGETKQKLVLSADKQIAHRGEVVTCVAVLEEDGKNISSDNITYEIVDGKSSAVLVENKLTINSDAAPGAVIKVVAKLNDLTSNEVEIVVSVPLTDITISANGVTNIVAGDSVTLTKTLNPTISDVSISDVEWVVVEGEDICTIIENELRVNSNVATGEVITIKAVYETLESNILTFTVGYPLQSIEVEILGSTNIPNGQTRPISTIISPSNATNAGNITWEFIKGEDLCVIMNGFIYIDENAPIGSVIEFKAVSGSVKSDVVSVVVGTPIETIELSAIGLEDGAVTSRVVNLKASVTPQNASTIGIAWEATTIVDDQTVEYVESITDGILTLKSAIPVGTIIKVTASSGSVSDELELTYGIYASSVVASANAYEVVKGTMAILSAEVAPANATDKTVSWQIVEGAEYVENITNGALSVKSDAATGAIIKIKAIAVGAESDVLTFTVMPTENEILASQYFIDVEDEITLDKNAKTAKTLTSTIYNKLFDEITDRELTYTLSQGAEYVEIIPNGNKCSFNILGHGTAVLEVAIKDMDVKKQVTINAIVPPEMVKLPGVFTERANYNYNFSKVDALPFVATALGEKVCTHIEYSFALTNEDGEVLEKGDEVATYSDGKITFNKLGNITVTASSNSGSAVETSTSYKFNINDGYNVYTFEELQALAKSDAYKGQIINVVVLEDPDGEDSQVYGYDLVSKVALKENQTFAEVRGNDLNAHRINFVCESVHINGNNHRINLSQLRVITKEEMDEWNKIQIAEGGSAWTGIYSIISIIPWSNDEPESLEGDHFAKIYDFEVIGNNSINFDVYIEGKYPRGAICTGIAIGSHNVPKTTYTIDLKNVSATKCQTGMALGNITGGTAENIFISDCFDNGITVGSSTMTFKNMKFASCGASAIELIPPHSNAAGGVSGTNQHITYEGYFDMSNNFNNGNTVFFNHYKIGNNTIPEVINGIIAGFNNNQLSHMGKVILNDEGNLEGVTDFGFVSFILAEMSDLYDIKPNYSEYSYPDSEDVNRGIINAANLPTSGKDTTHQYIELNVNLTSFGLGDVGKVLLYNHNYKG